MGIMVLAMMVMAFREIVVKKTEFITNGSPCQHRYLCVKCIILERGQALQCTVLKGVLLMPLSLGTIRLKSTIMPVNEWPCSLIMASSHTMVQTVLYKMYLIHAQLSQVFLNLTLVPVMNFVALSRV